MHRTAQLLLRALAVIACACPLLAAAQTLNITNDVQTHSTLANTAVTLGGKAELRITGTGDPIAGCTINLTSSDAWFFMTNIAPSSVVSTFLGRVRVNGATAVADSNVRVVQYANGTVVIPQPAGFQPLEVFSGAHFTGASKKLNPYTGYGVATLGAFNDNVRSFVLKRGYTATFAQNENGSGISQNYVAQDSDLEVSLLPAALNSTVSFVRVFPWRWVTKKGSCDVDPVALKATWHYNWSISANSTRDWEYVAIKQQPYWPGLGENWRTRGVNHLLGFNEPNNPVEDAYKNLSPQGSVDDAVARWPELLSTGLRVGAPAVTDGGYGWIVDFLNKASAAGMRVDYVPIHYYRSYGNKTDAAGAANQLYNFLKSIHDVAQRPIWVTEFNNGANWTDNAHDPDVTQNRNAIEAMLNMMDSTPWIERYAVYSNVEWFRDTHYADGSLTPMGVMYRDRAAPMAHVQVVPDSGNSPAAHYAFDGNTRDTLSGNNPLTYGTPQLVAGKHGNALSFDGTDDWLTLPARLGDSTDFTFAAWVNWNGGGNWQRIFDFGAGGTDNYICLTPKSGTNTLRLVIKQAGAEQIVETAALPTGTWTHVAVTLAGTTAKLFVNGTLRATNTAMSFNPGDLGTKVNYLGKSQWPDPLFSGKLDDVRVFTTGLSDAQIASMAGAMPPQFGATLYTATATRLQPFTGSLAGNATGGSGTRTFSKAGGPGWLAVAADGTLTGVPGAGDLGVNCFLVRVADSLGGTSAATLEVSVADAPGLVARYAFNGNTSASAGAMNGAATGSPTYATGREGSALDLDGTDDFVSFPAGIATYDEITLALWVQWDGSSNWQRIFDFGNGTEEYFFLTPKSGSNTLRFGIRSGGVEQTLNSTPLTVGQWTHVAVTLSANTGRLYVNGTLADTQAITIKPSDLSPALNYLGKSQWPDPLFNGRIDEFLIFNQALSAAQITALANSSHRAPVFTTDPISKPAAATGQSYEQTIVGTATDADAGSTLTFSKVSGPEWLTVSANGRISGVPTAGDAGSNRFIVRVTDETLRADDAVLNIAVLGASGLRAQYQFHNNTADSVGGSAATTTGSPAYGPGAYDNAINLDGADDFAQFPAGLVNGLADVTIATRVRWNGGNNWQRIFDFGTGTTQYLFLTPSSGSGTLRFAIKNGGAEQTLQGPALSIGEWAHVAVTLAGDTGTLYLNGAAVASGSVTLDPSAIAPTLHYLGKSQFSADPLFNGVIDDFRIYSRSLSASEISVLAVPPDAVVVPDSSYTGWSAGVAFPAGQSGAHADPDGDGLSNAWEYLFGKDPMSASHGVLPEPRAVNGATLGLSADKTYLTLQARVRRQRLGATLMPEAAASVEGLAAPEAASHARQAGAAVPDGDFETFTFYYDVPLEDSPTGSGAMRLRVTIQ